MADSRLLVQQRPKHEIEDILSDRHVCNDIAIELLPESPLGERVPVLDLVAKVVFLCVGGV